MMGPRRAENSRLLVAWVALIGVTQVNLLGGAGSFLLTPFLVLSPLVMVWETRRIAANGGWFRWPDGLSSFFLLLSAFLGVVIISTFFAFDPETSVRRAVLLFVQVLTVLYVGVALANRVDVGRILLRGAYAGLILSLVFNLFQILHWFTGDWLPGRMHDFITFAPGNYAGVIPRLTAVSHDPNLGGFIMLAYLALIMVLGEPSRTRSVVTTLTIISIILTLSRSAMLAGLVVYGLTTLRNSELRISPRALLIGSAGLMLLLLPILVLPGAGEVVADGWGVIGDRLSAREGSTSEHAAVIERAWEVATHDLKQLLLGVGYGNAYVTLQDIFPDNRYGNFHSFFLTILAESGVVAAGLAVLLFVGAFMRAGPYRPLLAGMLVYNLFQQTQTDPITWLILMIAWTGMGLESVDETHTAAGGAPGGEHVREMDDAIMV